MSSGPAPGACCSVDRGGTRGCGPSGPGERTRRPRGRGRLRRVRRATDRVHYLNPTATVVFSLCDGTRTTDEVAELVRSAWELDAAPVDDVVACIAQLRDEGVLT